MGFAADGGFREVEENVKEALEDLSWWPMGR
jgi:hypothetical protein